MSPFPYSYYAVLVAYDILINKDNNSISFWFYVRIIQQIFIFVRFVFFTLAILSEYYSYYRITIHELFLLNDYQKPISYYDHFSIQNGEIFWISSRII